MVFIVDVSTSMGLQHGYSKRLGEAVFRPARAGFPGLHLAEVQGGLDFGVKCLPEW